MRKYVDIRALPTEEKFKRYEEVHELWLQGKKITRAEHKSGFPAITIDCDDIHLLTDCLSLESWWQQLPLERQERKETKPDCCNER